MPSRTIEMQVDGRRGAVESTPSPSSATSVVGGGVGADASRKTGDRREGGGRLFVYMYMCVCLLLLLLKERNGPTEGPGGTRDGEAQQPKRESIDPHARALARVC